MKKILSLLLVFLCSWASAFAQSAEIYSSGDLKAKPGDKIGLSLSMKNEIEIKAWSFRLVLPEGVTVEKDSRGRYVYELGRTDEHSKDARDTSDEPFGVQFSVYGNYPFLDNDGTIISLNLLVSDNVDLGNKEIRLAKINYANMEDKSVYQDDLIIPLKIYNNFSVSATTANETMGSVKIEPSGDAVESGTSITATAAPNDGYSFVNWTSGETKVSTDNPYTFELAAATALTANFKAIKYPVVFKNDGAEVTNENIDFASVITAPKNPTKEGYTFLGWFDGNDVKFVEGATVPLNGVTYTAKWQINQYTITFDTDGGSEIAAITQDYNTAVTAPAAPTKTGYKFVGWDKEIPATMPAENITIKATWQIIQYTLSFDLNGGESEAISDITADYNSDVTKPADPTRTGYTFKGWDPEFTGKVPADNTTYVAQWTVNQYTITFDTDGGSEIAAITQDYNTAVTAPAAPTKTGYTFVSWDKEIPATMPAENITIKAIWQINKYTVTFDSNGGTEVAPITQDYATEINAPTAPTRVGYEFAGWDKDVPATMPAEDLTLTAQWTAKKFIYTFTKKDNKDNVASDVIEIEQTFDAAVVKPTDEQLNWEEHTFDKYVETVPETVTEEGAKTFTALYNINKYTVKFVVGEVIHEATLEYGSPITIPEIPAKEGYTGAWDKEVAKTVPAENVTYTAVYTPIEYTVTFNTDGGSEVASIKVTYGSAITLPEKNPTKEGYTFKEWGNVPATMPANDVELKAIWTINKYNVTFDFGFDGLVDTKDYEYNAEIVIPDVPSRAGWVFKGWEPEVAKTVPASDVTYTAQWELDIVKVRFVFWDGNTKEYEYKPGAEITEIPEVPAREGYTFKGWDKPIPDVVPVVGGELVITAQWSINKYAVYFIANKKTVYSAILPYGSEIVAPEAPEVEGYTFVGWTPEVDATVPARTVYYEAVYEVNTYKVTYYLNDEVVNVAEVKYGEAIPAYEPTVEEGMKFDGWQEEIPAVMPAYDLEIHGTTSGIETAIKNIVAKFGESFDVYNVSGRLVQRVNGASDISRIPAGMYIINGTKVVIRKD